MTTKNTTKMKLEKSIRELMREHSLEKITVLDITENCGITRQTFYNHFQDKFDLVNWIFNNLFEKTFHNIGKDCSWDQSVLNFLTAINEQKDFYSNAFAYDSQNCLTNYEFELVFAFYRNIIFRKDPNLLTENVIFQLELYCQGAVYLTAKWAKEGMKRSPSEMTFMFKEAMPVLLKEVLT